MNLLFNNAVLVVPLSLSVVMLVYGGRLYQRMRVIVGLAMGGVVGAGLFFTFQEVLLGLGVGLVTFVLTMLTLGVFERGVAVLFGAVLGGSIGSVFYGVPGALIGGLVVGGLSGWFRHWLWVVFTSIAASVSLLSLYEISQHTSIPLGPKLTWFFLMSLFGVVIQSLFFPPKST